MLRIYLPSSIGLKLCSDVPSVDFVDTWTFVTIFTSRYLGPNIWVLANKSKMICHQLWGNSVTLYNEKKFNNENLTMKMATMKIWQWKFNNENGNNENLTMKILTMKIWQWKCNNENANNEKSAMKWATMKIQQWKWS